MVSLPVVLMYHSVAKVAAGADPFDLHVSPENFRDQIEALSKAARIVSVAELAEEVARGRTPAGIAAISFDDGYENNLSVAAPILRDADAPATLFVCPGLLGREHFWWDRLIETIVSAARIPDDLDGLPNRLDGVGALLTRLKADDRQEARLKLSFDLWQALQGLELDSIDAVLAVLVERFEPRDVNDGIRPMRDEEVRAAAAFFDIGAHSLSHPAMTTLDSISLAREVAGSKAACERLSGKPVTGFAYPFGDVNEAVAAEASRHVSFACTTRETAVDRQTTPWRIPRIHVRDWSAEKLMAKIDAVTRMTRMSPPLRLAIQVARNPRRAVMRLAERAGLRT